MALAAGFRGIAGPDEISGTKRADTIRGPGGDDRLPGGWAGEIYGNGGSDRIDGDDRMMVDDGNKGTACCGSGTDHGCETVEG